MGDRSLIAALLGWSLLALPAHAAASPRLGLRVKVCPGAPLAVSDLEGGLRTELEADGLVQLSDVNVDGELFAQVGCDSALTTTIRLTSTRVGWNGERTIVLGDARPSARVGVLALAAAELVRSDASHLLPVEPSQADYPSETSTPPSQPAKAPAASPLPAAPSPPLPSSPHRSPVQQRRSWSLSASARLRWFIDYASVSWGGDAGVDVGRWRLRAGALLCSPEDALGAASLGSAAAGVGYRVLDQQLGPFQLVSYPMVALGATWMRGSATEPGVSVSPVTGPYVDFKLLVETRLAV